MSEQTIFRIGSVSQPFTLLGNGMLQNQQLSLEAKGFLAAIMSRPPNWEFDPGWAAKAHGITPSKLKAIVRELEALGYCIRYQVSYGANRFGAIHRYFTDQPELFLAQNPEIAKLAEAWRESQKRRVINSTISQPKQSGRPRKIPLVKNSPAGESASNSPLVNSPLAGNSPAIERKNLDSQIMKEDDSSFDDFAGKGQERAKPKPRRTAKQGGLPLGADEMGVDAAQAAINAEREFERAAFETFQELAREVGLDVPVALTSGRREAMRLIFERFGRETWAKAIENVRGSAFLQGKSKTGFRLSFDRLLREDDYVKVIEGFYNPREAAATVVPIVDFSAVPLARWESRMRAWKEAGGTPQAWPADWGPMPGLAGCGVPGDVLERMGVTAAA